MAKQPARSTLKCGRLQAEGESKRRSLKLASHRLLDEAIMGGKIRYVCMAREILAYPVSHGVFQRERDIVDKITRTRVPLSDLERVLGADIDKIYEKGIGLFIDPEGFDTYGGGFPVVIPKSVIILGNEETPFIQEANAYVAGKPDKKTGIPLMVPRKMRGALTSGEKRFFIRCAWESVRTLLRYGDHNSGQRREVNAIERLSTISGVAFEENGREKEMTVSWKNRKLVVEGSMEQLEAAVRALERVKHR